MKRKKVSKISLFTFSILFSAAFLPGKNSETYAEELVDESSNPQVEEGLEEGGGEDQRPEVGNSNPAEEKVKEEALQKKKEEQIKMLNDSYQELLYSKAGLEELERLAPNIVKKNQGAFNQIRDKLDKRIEITKRSIEALSKKTPHEAEVKAPEQVENIEYISPKKEENQAPKKLPPKKDPKGVNLVNNYLGAGYTEGTRGMINYALSKTNKVSYSMFDRFGPNSYDCSSYVYYCLIAGGFLNQGVRIGTTEDLFKLNGTVFQEIYNYEDVRAGDIFICGGEGTSIGEAGHTGIFLDKDVIIHCNGYHETVTINNKSNGLNNFLDCKRSRTERYFRPVG